MENQETREPVTTSIQRRLDLILSQVLLKLDLVIQRDLGKLNLSKYNSKTDESQPLKKKPQQSKKNEMESENREPTPPFLASIRLDGACPGSRPPQVQLAKLPPPQTTTVSPDRDSHVLPLNPSMPSSTTPVIPPSFSSPSPTPIADSNISPTPVQPPLDLVPSHPAYPKRPLEQDFELPSASVGPSLSRKKAKKKRKSKLSVDPNITAGTCGRRTGYGEVRGGVSDDGESGALGPEVAAASVCRAAAPGSGAGRGYGDIPPGSNVAAGVGYYTVWKWPK
ncbi:hypothetical protein VP01_4408g1, partial [Puccinia sorghi]